jgi:ferredoxin
MAFGSLDSLIKIVDFLNVPFIEINSGLCSDIRKRGSCDYCKVICPTDAIDIGREITIDPKKCVRCGSCATICHNGVFTLLDGSDEILLNKIEVIKSSVNNITIQCNGCNNSFKIKHKKLPKDMGKLMVPCHGRVNEIILLRIRELDFENVVFSDCLSECPYKSAWKGFYHALILNDNLRKTIIMVSNNSSLTTKSGKKSSKDLDGQNRRDFVNLAGKRAAAMALDINPTRKQITKQMHHLPVRRRALLDLLKSHEINDHIVKKGTLPFAEIDIMSECDLCGACSHICPTGTLTLIDNGKNTSITFDFPKCVGCELCSQVCDKGYLHIKDEANLGNLKRQPIKLHELPNRKCSNCEMSFVSTSEETLCPQCGKRNNLKRMMSESRN